MLNLRPFTPELQATLAHIERMKADLCTATMLTEIQLAKPSNAHLDQYMRTVSGDS